MKYIFPLIVGAMVQFAPMAISANAADAVAEGRALLEQNCSRCHAIDAVGDSPHEQAPPFRNILKIYPASSLEEALAEGLVTGHPDMPEFVFPATQVDSIIAYLRTLEVSP